MLCSPIATSLLTYWLTYVHFITSIGKLTITFWKSWMNKKWKEQFSNRIKCVYLFMDYSTILSHFIKLPFKGRTNTKCSFSRKWFNKKNKNAWERKNLSRMFWKGKLDIILRKSKKEAKLVAFAAKIERAKPDTNVKNVLKFIALRFLFVSIISRSSMITPIGIFLRGWKRE